MEGLDEVQRRLAGLSAWDRQESLFAVGELLAGSARERIEERKAAPDGTAWVPWSEAYDETRESRHSLLVEEGTLMSDAIQPYASDEGVAVGTNLIYAATHQMGREDVNIPARPFLGVSEQDLLDIEDLILGGIEEAGA